MTISHRNKQGKEAQDMDQKHVAHSLLNTSCLTLAKSGCLLNGRLKEKQNYQRDCDCRIKYMNRNRLDHSCIKFKNDCYFCSYINPFKLNLLGVDYERHEKEPTTE